MKIYNNSRLSTNIDSSNKVDSIITNNLKSNISLENNSKSYKLLNEFNYESNMDLKKSNMITDNSIMTYDIKITNNKED